MPQGDRTISVARALLVLFIVFVCTTSFFSASAARFRPSSRPLFKFARLDKGYVSIVPRPRHIEEKSAVFRWPAQVRIAAVSAQERDVATLLIDFLHQKGVQGQLATPGSAAAEVHLAASPNTNARIGAEGYGLQVSPGSVTITANSGAGLFYGLQTLEQITHGSAQRALFTKAATIEDWPAFRWRGMHLDVSRHFYPVPIVKRYLDVAAHYKLNTFHWHVTDDQGWRVEIKRYPRLTQIGSCPAGTEMGRAPTETDGKRYCGFYTQSQIRDVVAYAKRRNVTIVPEIEVPGHSAAALASYPELACHSVPYHVRKIWGTGETDVYCPSERTFAFLENVLSEVIGLFPGRYVHLGGDEVSTQAWHNVPLVRALMRRERIADYAGVQAYMMRRMERYLKSRGRRMVAWDEVLNGGVSRDAAIMSWRGEKPGIRAVKRGNDAVMTPDGPLYFDAYQGDRLQEPRASGNMSTLEQVYDYDPIPDAVSALEAAHILGVQANLWTEHIATPDYLFYMALPRELALAEIAWVPRDMKNWNSFLARLPEQFAWLEEQHYRFRVPNPAFTVSGGTMNFASVQGNVQSVDAQTDAPKIILALSAPLADAVIRFTTDGSKPTASSQAYSGPMTLSLAAGQRANVQAVTFLPDDRKSTISECSIRRVSLAAVKSRRHASHSWAALVSP